MKIEQAKQELVRRYKYLYENVYFIVAPFMYEQSEEDFKKMRNEYLKKYNDPILKRPQIYLKINRLDSRIEGLNTTLSQIGSKVVNIESTLTWTTL